MHLVTSSLTTGLFLVLGYGTVMAVTPLSADEAPVAAASEQPDSQLMPPPPPGPYRPVPSVPVTPHGGNAQAGMMPSPPPPVTTLAPPVVAQTPNDQPRWQGMAPPPPPAPSRMQSGQANPTGGLGYTHPWPSYPPVQPPATRLPVAPPPRWQGQVMPAWGQTQPPVYPENRPRPAQPASNQWQLPRPPAAGQPYYPAPGPRPAPPAYAPPTPYPQVPAYGYPPVQQPYYPPQQGQHSWQAR